MADGGNNGEDGTLPSPIPPGKGHSTLDLTTEKDRALVRQAVKNWPRRWRKLSPELMDSMVEDLEWARAQAKACPASESDPLNGAKVVLSVVKTAAMMEAQHQIDDHANEKNERLDNGKPTESVAIKVAFDNAG